MVLYVVNNMAIPEAAATLREYITRPSRRLKENWDVDLAALLQDYFQYLFKELEKSDNVRNAANFAEAALVIQASSEIYCKKVDYLFDHMLQLLGRLQSDKTDDPKDKQKCGRSRVDELEKSRLFEEVLRKVVVPDIKNGMAEKVKLLVDHFHLLVKLREKQLYGEVDDDDDDDDEGDNIDVDEIGEVTQNEASRKELTNKELLKKPLFPPSFWIDAFQMIEAGLRKLLHLGPEDPIDHAAVDAECERHKEQREADAVPDTQHNDKNAPNTQCNGENPPPLQSSEENGKVDEDVGYVTGNEDLSPLVAMPAGTCNEAGTSTTVDGDLVVLTPTENTSVGSPPPPPPEPPPVPHDQISMVLGTIPEQAALAVTSLPSTLLKRENEMTGSCILGLRKEEVVQLLLPELPKERPYHEKVRRKRKIRAPLTEDERIAIESLKDKIIVRPKISPEYLKESFLAQHGISIEANDPVPIESDVSVIYVIDVKNKKRLIRELEKRVIFERNLEALRRKYSQDLEYFRGFEDMELSDDETDGFCGFPSPPPVPGSGAAMVVEEEEGGDFHGFADRNVPETQPNSDDPSPVQVENEQQKSNNPSTSEQESSVNPPARHEKDDNAPVIELEAAKKWREFIAPKLTRAWERGHFEIHEYESEILEALPQNSTTRTLTFAEVVADKATEDIPRYFLATLQLANSCNIEIRKSDPDPLAMNCVEMTLLSTRRNEAMGEFHPPSENQGIRNPFAPMRLPFAPISPPFAPINLPFAEEQAHSSHQYEMQEDAGKPSRKRKCNQSKCKDAATSDEDNETQESEEDEWWLGPKKVARKRKLNKR